MTRVTLDAFQRLVPPFEAAFHTHRAAWRLDGQPRTARRCTVDKHCPRPTPDHRRCFLLPSLNAYAFQGVQGRLFGTSQRTAHPWMHVLLPARLAALRPLGAAPARSRTALAQRLGVSEADAAFVVGSREEAPAPVVAPDALLVPMRGPNGPSSAPMTRLHSK